MADVGKSPSATAAALAAMTAAARAAGAPYPPLAQTLGSPPSVIPDVPVSAVFLVLFLGVGIGHQLVFNTGMKKGRKFGLSGAMAGFCWIRVISNALRIAWSFSPTSARLALAAEVTVYAGTIILFLVNFFFTERVVRSLRPRLGWSRPFSVLFAPGLTAVAVLSVVIVMVASIQSAFTLDPRIRGIDRGLQLYVLTAFAAFAFIPIPTVTLTLLVPRRSDDNPPFDAFGSGRVATKLLILTLGSLLLTTGAVFSCATSYIPAPSLLAPPAAYLSRACFYIFEFGIELLVLVLYLAARVDRRFYVRNGAAGPGAYSGGVENAAEDGADEKCDAKDKEAEVGVGMEVDGLEVDGVSDARTWQGRDVGEPLLSSSSSSSGAPLVAVKRAVS